MKSPLIASCILLTSLISWAESTTEILESAEKAMDTGLYDVAANKLRDAANQTEVDDSQRSEISRLLVESLVRGGRPADALAILELPEGASIKNREFWRAQSLAGLGRFKEAAEILTIVAADQTSPLRTESALSAASLYLSLSLSEEALAVLNLDVGISDPKNLERLTLRKIEILLDLGRAQEAEEILPDESKASSQQLALVKFLKAYILLRQGKFTEANDSFTAILAQPSGQNLNRFNLVAIGKADALAGLNQRDAATGFLLDFIQENQEAPLLRSMFQRIVAWLPETIVSVEHPTIFRLKEWSANGNLSADGFINTNSDSVLSAWPRSQAPKTDLAILALYAKSRALHLVANEVSKAEAEQLMQRIRLIAPQHFIAPYALLDLARWSQEKGNEELALTLLEAVRRTATSPIAAAQAAFENAWIAFENGDPLTAADLFTIAADLFPGVNSETARLNSKLSTMSQSEDNVDRETIETTINSNSLTTELLLEKALATGDPAIAIGLLDPFILENPDHPRAIEARLAIAEAALSIAPPDISAATAQIATIRSMDFTGDEKTTAKLSLLELRLAELQRDPELVSKIADEIFKNFPNTRTSEQAALLLGKSLFNSGRYNEARLAFEKLATTLTSPEGMQVAYLMSARSAALGATAQSREEALQLFDQTIAINAPLSGLASLEKARLSIELNRLDEAIELLEKVYQTEDKKNPIRLSAGLLIAEALYAKTTDDEEIIPRSLTLFAELSKDLDKNSSQYYRLKYLHGLTLERDTPDPETGITQSLEVYFSVFDRPINPPPVHWEWFERCGFRALALLEKENRWKAAVQFAEKIATFGGPRAEEARTRARQIRLKQMIWED